LTTCNQQSRIAKRNFARFDFEGLKMSNAKEDFVKQLEKHGHGNPAAIAQVGVTELADSKLLAEVAGGASFWLKNADGSGTFVQSN
jgi:hypothetical protein